ncbi:M16 family metallopeptidase [Chitiniphilus shinanonensis]|uniref:M16 family metallopeptidase n=1 Tax=Chitiniphilus shinanonensis TaxID=553088 RepID=UPI00306701D2
MKHFRFLCALAASLLPLLGLAADAVREGRLANGLNYIVRSHATPADKVELRLLVRAGSLHEADDEQGIAHLVEHLAFGRTRHFAPGEVVDFLNGQGMRIGSDSNAFTAHHFTAYQLSVNRDAADRALTLLADWADGGVVFDPAIVARERTIVLDEMRLREAATKWSGEYLDAMFAEPRYGARMPIGQESVIRELPLARIQAFYRRHYVGPRMTLLVVGDLDAAQVEARVKQAFAKVPAGPAPAEPAVVAPSGERRGFTQFQAQWLARSQLNWAWVEAQPAARPFEQELADYRRVLAMMLVQARLGMEPGYWPLADLTPQHRQWILQLNSKQGGDRATVERMYAAIEAARRDGFGDDEVAEGKRRLRELVEANHPLEAARWTSAALVNQYQVAALMHDNVYEPAQLHALFERFAEQTDAAAVTEAWRDLSAQPTQVVSAWRAPSENATAFVGIDDDEVAQVVADLGARERLEGGRAANTVQLMAHLPAAGTVTTREDAPGGGVLHLANGATVVWQRQRSPSEQMGLSLTIDGGQLSAGSPEWLATAAVPFYLNEAGWGGLSREQVQGALAGKTVMLWPWVDLDTHGIGGTARAEEFETLLQLAHLQLLEPPPSAAARDYALSRLKAGSGQFLGAASWQRLYAPLVWPYDNWKDQDYRLLFPLEVVTAHRNLYGDPARWTVAVTGVADPARLEALVARYLGGVAPRAPSRATPEPQRLQPHAQHVYGGGPAKREASLIWRVMAPEDFDGADAWIAASLADILRQRLMASLRFEQGDSYGAEAGHGMFRSLGVGLWLRASVPADACARTIETSVATLRRLAGEGVTEAEFQGAQARSRKWVADLPQMPVDYASAVAFQYRMGGKAALAFEPARLYTRARLDAAAARWLAPQHVYLERIGCGGTWGDHDLEALWQTPARVAGP